MRYFYDTEFFEDGRIINLISIGMVAEDGREYYAISRDVEHSGILDSPWLIENVLPSLPTFKVREKSPHGWGNTHFQLDHPAYKCRDQIRDELIEFCRGDEAGVQFWGYYPAYDHVVLAQLFGSMIKMPSHWPKNTFCVEQLAYQFGRPLPAVDTTREHNALEDARWTRLAFDAVTGDFKRAVEHLRVRPK